MDAAFVAASVSLAKSIISPIAKKFGEAVGEAAIVAYKGIFEGFERYLSNSYQRHSYFSSIVFKNEQKRLVHYYEPLTVKSDLLSRSVLVDGYPSDLVDVYERVLIVDSAGMGKTTLLKYIFLKCVEKGGRIPVFVELRKLSKDVGVLDFIADQLSGVGGKCDPDHLRALVVRGDFLIFFDGYDEIPDGDRLQVSAGIQGFVEKAPLNRFVMTSREESGLAAFPSFQRFNIQPLSRDQSYSLLKKYGGQYSGRLIDLLGETGYSGIHEFLVNPLLTSLLYKSYEFKQVIPLRRHIFYRQVFEALFEDHDISKEAGFLRGKRCGFDIDRFDKLMRSLGFVAYRSGKVEYSKHELLVLVDQAKNLAGEGAVSASDVVHDLTHAVPLFVVEGNYYRWSHRSIQEYFSAAYICRDAKAAQETILKRLVAPKHVAHHANLLSLCADMDPVAFNKIVAGPLAQSLLDSFGKFDRLPNIDVGLQKERACLMAGKRIVVVGKSYSDALGFLHDLAEVRKRDLAVESVNKIHTLLGEFVVMEDDDVSYNAGLMWRSGSAVSFVNTRESLIVNSLFGRVDFPFVRSIDMVHDNEGPVVLDFGADLAYVDNDSGNLLNSLGNYELTNKLVRHLSRWEFDPDAAQSFLNSLRQEELAQAEVGGWFL